MLFDCEAEVNHVFVFTPETGPNELATPWSSTYLRFGAVPSLSTVPVNSGLVFRTGTMMPHELQCGA